MVLGGQLYKWTEADHTGVAFDSSTGFTLPNGAVRSPDAAWMLRERWEAIAPESRERFIPAAPDFVIELRSPTDRLVVLKDKMDESLESGVRLGWLIDPIENRAYIYAAGQSVVALDRPPRLAGEPVLPGFVLELGSIWPPI